MMHKPIDVDDYIAIFPDDIQEKLHQLRTTIKKAAPNAEEVISYNMPAYKQNGVLVYFAAYKNHIGLYPTASGINAFKNVLSDYVFSKGAVQFLHTKKLPLTLITKIVKFKVKENDAKASVKNKQKK